MLYLYNTNDNSYLTMIQYLQEIEAGSEDTYQVIFGFNLADLFTHAKKRTAIRGRYAKDDQGSPMLEKMAMTDDEQELFDDWIKVAAPEVFRCLSAWAKNLDYAYRHDVNFGIPGISGSADSVDGAVITDSSLALTPDAQIGKKLVVVSPGLLANQERTITDNSADTITLSSPFDSDITGLDFVICDATAKYIVYYIEVDTGWDANMLQGVENAIQESLVTYIIKEWYKINRLRDDFLTEEVAYQTELAKISSQLFQRKTPIKRPADWFEL